MLKAVRVTKQGDQQVADEGGKNLNPHGVFGASQEVSDFQMLLDPFEEQLDSPALLVALPDIEGAADKVVGDEYDRRLLVWPCYRYAAQFLSKVLVDSLSPRALVFESDHFITEHDAL